jgi:hypothetical protein
MRATGSLADPAQVLLDRWSLTGQSGTGGSRTGGSALDRVERRRLTRWLARISRGGSAGARPRGRDDDAGRIRHDRIEQLDLETDDRMEPDGFGCADEPDRAIEAVVVRDGQSGQP